MPNGLQDGDSNTPPFIIAGVHATEWIKIAIAVIGILIAINEFVIKNRNLEIAQINNSSVFLQKSSSSEVLNSLMKTVEYARIPRLVKSDKWVVLGSMTPIHEHLVAWAHCVATNLCDWAASNAFLCSRIKSYEGLAKNIFGKLSMSYSETSRDKLYSGLMRRCDILSN